MQQEWMLGVRGPAVAPGTVLRSAQEPRMNQSGVGRPELDRQPVNGSRKQNGVASAFRAELDKQLARSDVVVSNHARQRLEQRSIRLNETDLLQIGRAIDQVAAKGGKESLILLNQTAFLVNIRNRTIITAIDPDSMKDNVFTNIDSAIFL